MAIIKTPKDVCTRADFIINIYQSNTDKKKIRYLIFPILQIPLIINWILNVITYPSQYRNSPGATLRRLEPAPPALDQL